MDYFPVFLDDELSLCLRYPFLTLFLSYNLKKCFFSKENAKLYLKNFITHTVLKTVVFQREALYRPRNLGRILWKICSCLETIQSSYDNFISGAQDCVHIPDIWRYPRSLSNVKRKLWNYNCLKQPLERVLLVLKKIFLYLKYSFFLKG